MTIYNTLLLRDFFYPYGHTSLSWTCVMFDDFILFIYTFIPIKWLEWSMVKKTYNTYSFLQTMNGFHQMSCNHQKQRQKKTILCRDMLRYSSASVQSLLSCSSLIIRGIAGRSHPSQWEPCISFGVRTRQWLIDLHGVNTCIGWPVSVPMKTSC